MQSVMQKAKPQRLNFTKANLSAIEPPDAGRFYVYDAKQAGLCLCCTASGSKSFYLYRKVNGRPERMLLGKWPDVTVEQARDQAASFAGKVVDGVNPNDQRRTERGAPTLGEVFDEFLELPTRTRAKRPKSPKTKAGYRYQFDTFLEPLRTRRLSSITTTELEKLHNQLGEGHGFYMANRVLALLKVLFNVAIDARYYNVNPAARIRGFEETSRERFLQADELPAFFEALEAEPSEKIRDYVKLSLFTGQRRSNVLQMKWADVNLDRGLWTIPQTKTGKHEVPLTPEAVAILRRRWEARKPDETCEYVLPGRHGKEHLQDPMRQWRNILAAAGIKDLRLHDLRRSLGSWQAKGGASLSVIGKTLGHASPETTAIYSRLDDDPVRQSMTLATAAMLAAAKPKKARKPAAKGEAVKHG